MKISEKKSMGRKRKPSPKTPIFIFRKTITLFIDTLVTGKMKILN